MYELSPRKPGLFALAASLLPARIWTRLLSFVDPESFSAGVAYTSDAPIEQSYPTVASMAALSAFPWVRACVAAKADDVSKLPVHVMRDGEVVEDHPMNTTLMQPATRTTWRWWCRQAIVDYELSGNHYSLITGSSLLRWHPDDGNAVAQENGQIQGFTYREDGKSYAWEDVLYVRNVSWMRGPEGLIGEGSIRCLSADLTAEINSKRMVAKQAKRGRLEGIFSPASGSDVGNWGKSKVDDLKTKISAWTLDPDNTGYMVLGGPIDFNSVTVTPADLQVSERSAATRDATLAVFSVPPARLSLPTANFATQAQQMKTYWEALASGPIGALEDALTRMARQLSGNNKDKVVFDLSGVEALQEAMAIRLQRVSIHILNGMSAPAAYAMEGVEVPDGAFVNTPLAGGGVVDPDIDPASAVSVAGGDSEAAVVSQVSLNGAQIQSAIAIVQLVAAGQLPRENGVAMLIQFFGLSEEAAEDIMGDVGVTFFISEDEASKSALAAMVTARLHAGGFIAKAHVPTSELERADRWHHFIRAQHNPAVLRLNLAVSTYLAAAALRYNARLEEVAARAGFERADVNRDLSDAQIAEVLAVNQEAAAALEELLPPMRAAILSSFRANAAAIGETLTWNEANSGLAEIATEAVTRITTMSGEVVASVAQGLDEGLTISQVQEQLIHSRAFSPSRALRVARTEATRLANTGANEAITAAAAEGIVVQKQWLTARDNEVRRSHIGLDGQTVGHDEQFSTSDGHTASHPGGFGIPGEDINCFVPGTVVSGQFVAGVRSHYTGQVIELKTAGGRVLTVTPHHPIATPAGLVAANEVSEGDHLLAYGGDVEGPVTAGQVQHDHGPAAIEKVFEAISELGVSASRDVGVEDLHGDAVGVNGKIDVVVAKRLLWRRADAPSSEGAADSRLTAEDVASPGLPGDGPLDLGSVGIGVAASATPCPRTLPLDSAAGLDVLPLESLRFGATPEIDAAFSEPTGENTAADPGTVAKRLHRFSSVVSADVVVEVRRFDFEGHVYDLQSTTGLMVADGLVVSNCRCTVIPVVGAQP